uniref:Uncharacterized protein n=1 Tax=Anguilla anguilla TaxID=7936 RepID=A0A0E9VHC4_ANGAN
MPMMGKLIPAGTSSHRGGKQYNWVSALGSYQLLQYVTTYAHYQRLRKCVSRRMIAEEALEQIFDRDSV